MRTNLRRFVVNAVATLTLVLISGAACAAQQVNMALLEPEALPPAPIVRNTSFQVPKAPVEHRFWDKQNYLLFGAVAAGAAADFAVTHSNLQRGGSELNPLTRPFAGSTAGLAVNFAGETAGVIGLSYFFHKTGHHKLERMTSMVDLGSSAFAVTYGLTHR